ncbi:hypothetical protein [Paenibacillus amylolyticus]|uniref:hypothetical protein n=1 Tax=Paenibacillus amylolyticus TaxID=1451 RepID=UPI00344C4509
MMIERYEQEAFQWSEHASAKHKIEYINFVLEVNFMNKDELFMHKAIEIALQARKEGNEPFGP